MSGLSLILRLVACGVVAFFPFTGLDRWCWDQLFRLRGTLRDPTTIALVLLDSEDSRQETLKQLETRGARLIVPYSDSSLEEDSRPDEDCVARHATLSGGSNTSPTLLSYHRLIGTSGQPLPPFPVAIDFRGPAGSYALYRSNALPDSEVLRDRVLLVGRKRTVAAEVQTPFGPLSELEVQANILDTLWHQRALRVLPRWISIFGALLTIALSAWVLLRWRLSFAWILLTTLAALWVAAGVLTLAEAKALLGIANPLLCIVVTNLLLLGYRVRRQEAENWRTRRETEYVRQLDEFKNNFVSLFSHDLKTPIARIKAVVQLALSEPSGHPKLQEALRNIDRASDDLARLIGDILKVTKMESMSLELQRDAVDVNRMVEMAVARLKHVAEEKRIRFLLDLEPLFPIEGDPQLIQEIILNLAENAVKYSPPNSEVLIRTVDDAGRVKVTVSDPGRGIPPDELPRVTGKFYRGSLAANSTSGSGLGLYLAKYFVEMHQGQLEIRSTLGTGTEVSFWLPSPD